MQLPARIWKLPPQFSAAELKQFEKFSQQVAKNVGDYTPEFLELAWRRDIREVEQLQDILTTELAEAVESADLLHDAKTAAQIIIAATKDKLPITVYGDYDVDGITATSLLWDFLFRELGAKDCLPFVPNRSREGYGLNEGALRGILEKNGKSRQLLITVDCGIKDQELIAKIKADFPNLQVIITDHHTSLQPLIDGSYPEADAVVHPGHKSSRVEPAEICACAVAWLLITKIKKELGLRITSAGLDLVALATSCDLMPLKKVNRQFIKLGLAEFAQTNNEGLKALLKVANVDARLMSNYHLGYVIGPRVNAAGRIGDPLIAVRLLCTKSPATATELAAQLDSWNKQRQALTVSALEQSEALLDPDNLPKILLVQNPDWEEGIVGLIAGKLQEKYSRPSLAVTTNHAGEWVGSARSNSKINITELLAGQSHLLKRYGGHAQAAGFTAATIAELGELSKELEAAASSLDESLFQREQQIDAVVARGHWSEKFLRELDLLGPYGPGNPTPHFLLQTVIKSIRCFGRESQHCQLFPADPLPESAEILWFNNTTPQINKPQTFLGSLGYNQWQGRTKLQFIIRASADEQKTIVQ
jgi:single-stranded-DNA-specific exonuclease